MELAAVLTDGNEVTTANISFPEHKASNLLIQEDKTMKEYNVFIIEHYLKKYDRNVLRVAQKLDIGKSTIYKMIQKNELHHNQLPH
jgi:DNA-binding NtrC family response regulator